MLIKFKNEWIKAQDVQNIYFVGYDGGSLVVLLTGGHRTTINDCTADDVEELGLRINRTLYEQMPRDRF